MHPLLSVITGLLKRLTAWKHDMYYVDIYYVVHVYICSTYVLRRWLYKIGDWFMQIGDFRAKIKITTMCRQCWLVSLVCMAKKKKKKNFKISFSCLAFLKRYTFGGSCSGCVAIVILVGFILRVQWRPLQYSQVLHQSFETILKPTSRMNMHSFIEG